jgi:hypothetical protein
MKRDSKSFKNGIAKSFWKKKKFLYLPPSPGFGPLGLLAHPPAGLPTLLSPPLPQARAHPSLGSAQLGNRNRSPKRGPVEPQQAHSLLPLSGSLTRRARCYRVIPQPPLAKAGGRHPHPAASRPSHSALLASGMCAAPPYKSRHPRSLSLFHHRATIVSTVLVALLSPYRSKPPPW